MQTEKSDIVKKWEERAKRCNADVSKWIYGDALYESVFDKVEGVKRIKL